MANFDKLTKVFEEDSSQDKENGDETTKFRQLNTLQKSLAIVKTIEKLKAQGVPITKKAEFDYLLARQVLDNANISPPPVSETTAATSYHSESQDTPLIKRNPKDNPEDFEAALEFSRKTVSEVEELLAQNKPVPLQQLEAYDLCKKFLKKYT